jgi:hypothetical protein
MHALHEHPLPILGEEETDSKMTLSSAKASNVVMPRLNVLLYLVQL